MMIAGTRSAAAFWLLLVALLQVTLAINQPAPIRPLKRMLASTAAVRPDSQQGPMAYASAAAAASSQTAPLVYGPHLPPAPPSFEVSEARLDALLEKLVELESAQVADLTDCDRWNNINRRYTRLAGKRRVIRQSEFAMSKRCRQIQQLVGQAKARLDHFRELFLYEDDQLELFGSLVSEYVDLQQAMEGDEHLAHEYAKTLEAYPQVRTAVQSFRSFVGYFLQLLAHTPEFAAKLSAASDASNALLRQQTAVAQASELVQNNNDDDDINQLDQELRRLIDREHALSEDEFRQLNDMASILERVLADRSAVDVNSGKFRCLSGTLDGARAVILHKLNGPDEETGAEEGPQSLLEDPNGYDFGRPPMPAAYESEQQPATPADYGYAPEQPQYEDERRDDLLVPIGFDERGELMFEREFQPPTQQQVQDTQQTQQARQQAQQQAQMQQQQQQQQVDENEEEDEALAAFLRDFADKQMKTRNQRPSQQMAQNQQQQQPQAPVKQQQQTPIVPVQSQQAQPQAQQQPPQQQQQQQAPKPQTPATMQQAVAQVLQEAGAPSLALPPMPPMPQQQQQQPPATVAPSKLENAQAAAAAGSAPQSQSPVPQQSAPAVPDKLKRLRQRNFVDL